MGGVGDILRAAGREREVQSDEGGASNEAFLQQSHQQHDTRKRQVQQVDEESIENFLKPIRKVLMNGWNVTNYL